MSETIVLPRSGVVLKPSKDGKCFEVSIAGERVVIAQHVQGYWRAWGFGRDFAHDKREIAVKQLDGFLLALRSALLVGARETIAKTCFDFDRSEEWHNATPRERETYFEQADAVLAALGVEVTP